MTTKTEHLLSILMKSKGKLSERRCAIDGESSLVSYLDIGTLQMQQRLFELSARCDGKFEFGTLYSVDSRI